METLRGIAGIGFFPALSLLLFVAVFATVIFRVLRMDGGQVRAFADLPVDRVRDACVTGEEAAR